MQLLLWSSNSGFCVSKWQLQDASTLNTFGLQVLAVRGTGMEKKGNIFKQGKNQKHLNPQQLCAKL